MDKLKAAYLAGLIDGEGSIMLRILTGRHSMSFQPVISVTITNKAIIELIHQWLGVGHIHQDNRDTKGYKATYCWRATSHKDVHSVLAAIQPYLHIKREHADLLLTYVTNHQFRQGRWWYSKEMIPDWEIAIANHLAQLNQRSTKIMRPLRTYQHRTKQGQCRICEQWFSFEAPAQKYCSPECSHQATLQRDRKRHKMRYVPRGHRIAPSA